MLCKFICIFLFFCFPNFVYSDLISDLDLDTKGLEKALTNPIPQKAKQQALEADRELINQYQICTDVEVIQHIKSVVNKIIANTHLKNVKFKTRVLENDDINAFVTGGEYIYVFTGLLNWLKDQDKKVDENELAGILAHEISHVAAGHTWRSQKREIITNIGAILVTALDDSKKTKKKVSKSLEYMGAGYSREHEREADILGTIYMKRAGYEPMGFVNFFKRMWKEQEKTTGKLKDALQTSSNELAVTKKDYDEVSRKISEEKVTIQNLRNTYSSWKTAYTENPTQENASKMEEVRLALNQRIDHYNALLGEQKKMGLVYNQKVEEFKKLQNAGQQYVAAQNPWLRSHPIDSERINLILKTAEYANSELTKEDIKSEPDLEKIIQVLEKTEPKSEPTKNKKSRRSKSR